MKNQKNEEIQTQVYKDDNIEVTHENNDYFIYTDKTNIVILPIIENEQKQLDKLIVHKQKLPTRYEFNIFPIIVQQNFNDASPLKAAQRNLYNKLQIEEPKLENWKFLGEINTSKFINEKYIVYAVRISDEQQKQLKELDKKYLIVNPIDILKSDEALLLSTYFRLIKNYF